MIKRAIAMALLEAIREKDKGCPFCMAGEAVQGKTARMGMRFMSNELNIHMTVPRTGRKIGTMFRIKFCPNCGRKFKEDD